MGESVAEATLTSWLKDVGDSIDMDEPVVEIATDKVDSEVPSEHKGVLIEKCFKINEVIKVGETIAIIETDSEIKTAETIIEIDQKNDSNAEKMEMIDETGLDVLKIEHFAMGRSVLISGPRKCRFLQLFSIVFNMFFTFFDFFGFSGLRSA